MCSGFACHPGTRLDGPAILALGETAKRAAASARGAMAMAARLAETATTTGSAGAAERYGSALRELQARVCELGEAQSGIQHRLSQLTTRLNLLLAFSHHGFVASSSAAAGRPSDILDLELERLRRMPLSDAVIAMSAVIAATCDVLDAEVSAVEATLTSLNAGHGSSI